MFYDTVAKTKQFTEEIIRDYCEYYRVDHFEGSLHQRLRTRFEQDAKAKGRHKDGEWRRIVLFFAHLCVKCDKPDPTGLDVEKDHIVGIRQGGCDCAGNLQPLCSKCNRLKNSRGNLDMTDYRLGANKRRRLSLKTWNLIRGYEADTSR